MDVLGDRDMSVFDALVACSVPVHDIDVLVVGAGQAGLTVAHELYARGFRGYVSDDDRAGTFLVLDDQEGPGGTWRQCRFLMDAEVAPFVAQLPNLEPGDVGRREKVSSYVARSFSHYEDHYDFPILRPVHVSEVTLDSDGRFCVATDSGLFRSRYLINCTGRWSSPVVPEVEGADIFRGPQFHTSTMRNPDTFWRQRVLVIGEGLSVIDHLDELWGVAKKVRWAATGEPTFESDADLLEGRLIQSPKYQHLMDNGGLRQRPMIDRLDHYGAWWGEKYRDFDAIIWATGFTSALDHLAPLGDLEAVDGLFMVGLDAYASAESMQAEARTALDAIVDAQK